MPSVCGSESTGCTRSYYIPNTSRELRIRGKNLVSSYMSMIFRYIYIYMLIYSDPIFQWYFNCFIHLLFCKPQNPRGWKCSSLSPLRWALRNRGVILSLLRGVGFSEKKKHICNYGSKTPVMDVSYTEPHVWFMITLFKTIVLWFFYTFPMGFPWKKTGKGF